MVIAFIIAFMIEFDKDRLKLVSLTLKFLKVGPMHLKQSLYANPLVANERTMRFANNYPSPKVTAPSKLFFNP